MLYIPPPLEQKRHKTKTKLAPIKKRRRLSMHSVPPLPTCLVFTYMVRPSCFSFSLKGRTRMTTRTLSSPGEEGVNSLGIYEENDDDDEAMAGGNVQSEVGGVSHRGEKCPGSCANVMVCWRSA